MKTIEEHFKDWESATFGYGYGSGEDFIIPVVKTFLETCFENANYDYTRLEKALGGPVAWLLINIFCKTDILEYGTSPRFGWLTDQGRELKKFVGERTPDQLLKIIRFDVDYTECYPDFCNCPGKGFCLNPFWPKNEKREKP